MRRRKIIALVSLVVLGAGITTFLLLRDSGPPVQVTGNFTAKDVAQIKRAFRRELWREVLPDLSKDTVKSLPHNLKRAFTTHVVSITAMYPAPFGADGAFGAVVLYQRSPDMRDYCWLTNGPAGWSMCRPKFQFSP